MNHLVLVIGGDLGTNAPAKTLGGALLHLLEVDQTLLGAKLTALARNSVETLSLHSLLVGIVGIGLTSLDDFDTIGIQLIEVVAGVRGFVGFDALFESSVNDHTCKIDIASLP